MPTTPLSGVVHYLRRISLVTEQADLADGDLLTQFLSRRDENAFASLVHRHGPMVFRVCRRLLPDVHEAEDAFQATFLVLARKASAVRPRGNVGGWLHGVAYRTALKARTLMAKRRGKEMGVQQFPDQPAPARDTEPDIEDIVDRALQELPEKFRSALVMCDLEGRTQQEAARLLQCPRGTLSSRLLKGRELLAKKLTARGLSGTVFAALLANRSEAALSYPLVATTVQGALASGEAATKCSLSTNVITLAQGVSNLMLREKLNGLAWALLVIGTLTLTAAWIASNVVAQAPGQQGEQKKPKIKFKIKAVQIQPGGVKKIRIQPIRQGQFKEIQQANKKQRELLEQILDAARQAKDKSDIMKLKKLVQEYDDTKKKIAELRRKLGIRVIGPGQVRPLPGNNQGKNKKKIRQIQIQRQQGQVLPIRQRQALPVQIPPAGNQQADPARNGGGQKNDG